MKDIKFRYVYKQKSTGKILLKYWTLADIEENGLPVYYSQYDYGLISRDLCIKIGGLELYENDKVKVDSRYISDNSYKMQISFIGVVTLDEIDGLEAMVVGEHDSIDLFDWYYNYSDKKVIGNIYEQ
jgi:hypothetical protein